MKLFNFIISFIAVVAIYLTTNNDGIIWQFPSAAGLNRIQQPNILKQFYFTFRVFEPREAEYVNTYIILMSTSWNFLSWADPSWKGSEPSRVELGHFNFWAETELTICISSTIKFPKFTPVICSTKCVFRHEWYDLAV